MNPCELAAFVSAAAIAVAKNTPDNEELGLLALAFRQLADTLGRSPRNGYSLRKKNKKKRILCSLPTERILSFNLLSRGDFLIK